MIHLENNLKLNNMERLSACSVKIIDADAKYEQDDYIILGTIGKNCVVSKILAVVDERFQAGAGLEFGTVDAKYETFNPWTAFPIDDTLAGDIVHINIPMEDNADHLGNAYTGENPCQYSKDTIYYARFVNSAPGDVGQLFIDIEYAYIKSNQTGAYLS